MSRRGTEDVLEVMRDLWELDHALEARSKRMHRESGITGPQRLLLRMVGRSPGCSQEAAARRLHLDPGTVSRLAVALVRSGLVRRDDHETDGRAHRLVPTRRGKAMIGRTRGTVEAAVQEAIASAPPAEIRMARRFVRRLTGALAATSPPPRPSPSPRRAASR